MIAAFSPGRLGQEPPAGQPLVGRLGRLVRDVDVLLARATGVPKSSMDDDEERRRHVFKLLAGLFADLGASVSAVRAGQLLGGQLVLDPFPGQALWQLLPPPAAPLPRRFLFLILRRPCYSNHVGVFGRIVGEQPELVGIDALPPGAELATEQ